MDCNKCNDDPYDVHYVDVGIGTVPAAILWHCHECYEVIEKGRNRRIVRFEALVTNLYYAPLKLWQKFMRLFSAVEAEEDDIPF